MFSKKLFFIIFTLVFSFFLIIGHTPVSAETKVQTTIQAPIPNVGPATGADDSKYNFSTNKLDITGDGTTRPLAEYVRAIIRFGIAIVGILATVMMMFGGMIWLTSSGNSSKVGEAQTYIVGAFTGLALALFAWLILAMINPNLVNFKVQSIKQVSPNKATHSECKTVEELTAAGTNISTIRCVQVDGSGINQCATDAACELTLKKKFNCCKGTSGVNTSCETGENVTLAYCESKWNTTCNIVGVFKSCYFSQNSYCDASKNCVSN
ncbi:MAG: pilin [Candidatus Falkowbacteria bacterium]